MDTTQLIKQLRDETGVSVMACKNALEKAGGDIEKARIILREEGLATADKKADRETKAGIISSFVTDDNKSGSIVEFRAETDFVARNEEFIKLSSDLAKQVAMNNPENIESLLNQKMIDNESETVDSSIRNLVAKIGEKMEIGRFERIEGQYVSSYIHAGSRLGVLLEMKAETDVWGNESAKALAYDISMQIAAMSPVALTPENLSETDMKNVKDFIEEELKKENKPEEIKAKIMQGRIQKRFSEICLAFQPFIKNDSLTIEKLLEEKGKELGGKIEVVKFLRYQI